MTELKGPALRKANTAARNLHICNRFNELYQVQRIRYDDVVQQLSKELFLTRHQIERILREKPIASPN